MNEATEKENNLITAETQPVHGGDVYSRDIDLDFSVNINPCAEMLFRAACSEAFLNNYSERFSAVFQAAKKGLDSAVLYPDFKYEKLKNSVSKLEKVPADNIVCGNGASELFMAIVHAVNPEKALLLSPCYSGYERALKAADGCSVEYYELKENNGFALDEGIIDKLTKDIDIFFLADPNNPTGKLVDMELKDRIEKACENEGILLVKDECFYSLTERGSLENTSEFSCTFKQITGSEGCSDNVLLMEQNEDGGNMRAGSTGQSCASLTVKAFTKSLAVPGLRLGYLYGDDTGLLDRIRTHLPEWNISTIAQETGAAAADFFRETAFLKDSVKYITNERKYISDNLKALGMTVYESDTNYILAKCSKDIYNALLEKKILIRNCLNYPGLDSSYVRFAVRGHNDNARLIKALEKSLNGK